MEAVPTQQFCNKAFKPYLPRVHVSVDPCRVLGIPGSLFLEEKFQNAFIYIRSAEINVR